MKPLSTNALRPSSRSKFRQPRSSQRGVGLGKALIEPSFTQTQAQPKARAALRAAKVARALAMRLSRPWPSHRFIRAQAYDE